VTITGAGVSAFGDAVAQLSFDSAGAVTTPGATTIILDAGSNLTLTATTGVIVGDAGDPTVDVATGGNLTMSGNPVLDFGTGQADFGGNLDANAGLDVSGAALTVAAGQVLTVDTINETTGANGILIDSVQLKDGGIRTNSSLGDFVLDPQVGGEITRKVSDFGITALDTGGATTVITVGIPDGANLIGVAANITTSIADVSASGVTVNLAFTG